MAGRHRDQNQVAEAAGPVEVPGRRHRGLIILISALLVPGVVLGIAGAAQRFDVRPAAKSLAGPGLGGSPAEVELERPRPKTYPTYGEYVPPRVVKTATPRPTPRSSPSSSPRPKPSAKRSVRRCPRQWLEIPMLRRWCQRNGYQFS